MVWISLLVLKYRFYRSSSRFIGLSWTNYQMFSHLRILTPISLFFKLKCRVISNQHKWLNREHSQSRYHTTISWPGEGIYWHSPHEQDVHWNDTSAAQLQASSSERAPDPKNALEQSQNLPRIWSVHLHYWATAKYYQFSSQFHFSDVGHPQWVIIFFSNLIIIAYGE